MSKNHFEDGLKQQKISGHYILISMQGIMQNFISHIHEKINYSMSLFYFLACLHVLHAFFLKYLTYLRACVLGILVCSICFRFEF